IISDGVTVDDMKEQFDLACNLRDLMTEARFFQAEIEDKAREWEKRVATGKRLSSRDKAAYEKFTNLYRNVITETGVSYPQPMLIDQISYLNSQMGSSDQKPGKDLYTRFYQLTKELGQSQMLFEEMKK
ncbi:MAG: hypothetical protein IH591_20255, partial [Bacteroidales bacterium]|nr:hypothetical protein [Bacteroidales bacterium]